MQKWEAVALLVWVALWAATFAMAVYDEVASMLQREPVHRRWGHVGEESFSAFFGCMFGTGVLVLVLYALCWVAVGVGTAVRVLF